MNKDKIAKEVADLGQEEAALMRALLKVQAKRCKLLSEVACHADTGLSPDVSAAAVAPKDGGGK